MKWKPVRRSLGLVLLSALALGAGEPWKEKAYTEWTPKDVEKIIQESPWVRRLTVHMGYAPTKGVGGGTVDPRTGETVGGASSTEFQPIYSTVFVRWASSRTMREALMRNRQLRGTASEEEVKAFVAERLEHYVVTVGPLPLKPEVQESLSETAYLQPKGSKQKAPPARVEIQGNSAVFFFPRQVDSQPVIRADEKKVKFFCRFPKFKIETDFDLRKMVREGKADL